MTADTATDTDTATATHLQIHPQDTLAANYKYSHECKDSHSQGHKHNKPIRIHRDTVTDAVPVQRYKIQLHKLIQLHIHIHMYIDTAFTSGLIVMSIAYSGRLETK